MSLRHLVTLSTCALLAAPITGQITKLRITVALVDADLNVKAVPRHVLLIRSKADPEHPTRLVVGFDGKGEIELAPGSYTVDSEQPVVFAGRGYKWSIPIDVRNGGEPLSLELSVDNALLDRPPSRRSTLERATSLMVPRTIEDDVLDRITLRGPAPNASTVVVVRPFESQGADLGSGNSGGKAGTWAKRVQELGPARLTRAIVAQLTSLGPYKRVRADDATPVEAEAVVLEGVFSTIDPGSAAKRFWVGMGAGKSVVEVQGTVRGSDGTPLADFIQKRLGVMSWGLGDSEEKLTDDCRRIGEDIAKFLSQWGRGRWGR